MPEAAFGRFWTPLLSIGRAKEKRPSFFQKAGNWGSWFGEGHMVKRCLISSFLPAPLSPSRLNPAAALPPTQLPSQQALLWWALLAMAPPAPRTRASPAADKTPHLPSASSPHSPPKEPPTRLGAAPPTLRILPTPAGTVETPSGTPRFWELPLGRRNLESLRGGWE